MGNLRDQADWQCFRGGGGGGGGAGLPYEKVGDARREFLFWPPGGSKKGVVQAFKVPKPAAYGIGNARFVAKASFCREISLHSAPDILNGSVSTAKCYCLVFSSLSGTGTRDFDH